jgi:hypothetical protein
MLSVFKTTLLTIAGIYGSGSRSFFLPGEELQTA